MSWVFSYLYSPPLLLRLHLRGRGRISYTDEGSGGVTIVAVHGGAGSSHDFRYMGPHILPHQRFVRVELPGAGETPIQLSKKVEIPRFSHIVVDFIRALAPGTPVYVVGHSWGEREERSRRRRRL